MVGPGDTVDKSNMTALPAGSFVAVPAGVHHYAVASGDTIIQLQRNGPDDDGSRYARIDVM